MDFIPVYKPRIAKNQRSYVLDCVDSNMLSFRGKYLEKVEKELANFLTTDYFSTTFNGSVSLMTILSALNIKSGDEVITQSLTYAATVFSILNVGATPVLIDCDESFQMDLNLIEKAITKRTKAVMVAQLYGNCPKMDKLKEICDSAGIHLIEDSAECFGCSYLGKPIGSFGIASSFSFFCNKVICSAGEGGGIATSDSSLIDKINFIKSQSHSGGFIHKGPIGYNHRATNLQGAVLLAQFEEINNIIKRKKEIADYYRKHLHQKIIRVKNQDHLDSSEWMLIFKLPDNITYYKFQDELKKFNIDSRPCFTPIHLMEGFNKCRNSGKLEVSSSIHRSGFNLPSYPDLTTKELMYIVKSVNKVINNI